VLINNVAGTAVSKAVDLYVYMQQSDSAWKKMQTVSLGEKVSLDTSSSISTHPSTTHVSWKFDFHPNISNATISLTDALHATFTPDIPGHYIILATGFDGTNALWSNTFRVRVNSLESGIPDSGITDPLKLAQAKNCMACHAVDKKLVGPAYRDIAVKYRSNTGAPEVLAQKIIKGSSGVWGQVPMPANSISSGDTRILVTWILAQ
jgi:cytochrome c